MNTKVIVDEITNDTVILTVKEPAEGFFGSGYIDKKVEISLLDIAKMINAIMYYKK